MTAEYISKKIDAYFNYINGEYVIEDKNSKKCIREAEPPTLAGYALFLGFNSRQAYDDYEVNGEFAHIVKRGRLRIEAEYEKKLHNNSSGGAIFALKSLGWNEKTENLIPVEMKNLQVEIIECGHVPASSENEVKL